MSIKAVFSDLGGVLIEFSFDRAAARLSRLAGVDARALSGKLVSDEAWEQFEVGRLTEAEFCSHLRQQCELNLTDAELVEGWNSIYIGVNRDVERLLREVSDRGVRVVGVTNTNVTHQRAWQDQFADNLVFLAAVYSSWEVGARKPEPAFFEHVLEAEQVAAHEVLFIDDLAVNVEAADSLGMDALIYTCFDSLREAFARRGLLGHGSGSGLTRSV